MLEDPQIILGGYHRRMSTEPGDENGSGGTSGGDAASPAGSAPVAGALAASSSQTTGHLSFRRYKRLSLI